MHLRTFATLSSLVLVVSGCASGGRRDAAFASSCSTAGAPVLLSGAHVVGVTAVLEPTNKHGGDDHEVRGAELLVAHRISAQALEHALQCHAARADREALLPLDTPLDVTPRLPEVTVKRRDDGHLVVAVVAQSERDGERILASAKRLGERARKPVADR